MEKVIEGVIIGAAGGASAGIILAVFKGWYEWFQVNKDTKRVLRWLDKVCSPEGSQKWRSTHAVASHNNLTLQRVQYICSRSEKIARSSKEKEMWGLVSKTRGKGNEDIQ